jgi:hypothetical protein
MTHVLRITAAIAGITLCTLLPFLPGRYDRLAVPLSFMAQLFGLAGLILVPLGVLWLASGYWSPLAGKQYVFAVASLVVASLVWAIVSLGAATSGGAAFGVIVLAIGSFVLVRLGSRLEEMKGATPKRVSPIAMYLIVLPVAAALLRFIVVRPAIEFSRSRAIQNSTALIADIERYRVARGRYPPSLVSLWKDYEPSLIGIEQFHYEISGDAYNLLFEQFAYPVGTREIVVYNPRDQQAATSHDMDLLQPSPGDLERQRGYYAVHDTRHPHWKYFWFD